MCIPPKVRAKNGCDLEAILTQIVNLNKGIDF